MTWKAIVNREVTDNDILALDISPNLFQKFEVNMLFLEDIFISGFLASLCMTNIVSYKNEIISITGIYISPIDVVKLSERTAEDRNWKLNFIL